MLEANIQRVRIRVQILNKRIEVSFLSYPPPPSAPPIFTHLHFAFLGKGGILGMVPDKGHQDILSGSGGPREMLKFQQTMAE